MMMQFVVTTLKTMRAVVWSFLGIRKSTAFEDDIRNLTPLHILGVGLLFGFLLVIGLMLTVWYVVKR